MVADVDHGGNLTLPFIDKERAAALLADTGKVEDLRVAGQAPQKVVDVARLERLGREDRPPAGAHVTGGGGARRGGRLWPGPGSTGRGRR
jgi:hypothetical protein